MKINIKLRRVTAFVLAVILVLNFGPFKLKTYADPEHTHNEILFTEWNANNALPDNAGHYYLNNDVTLYSTWIAPEGTFDLCLNGHTITIRDTAADKTVINVNVNSTLNIYECDENNYTGKIKGLSRSVAINIDGGTVRLYGGKIEGSGGHGSYGVESFQTGGNFIMYGGKITGNETGILCVDGSLNVELIGGQITGNNGGIYSRTTTGGSTNVTIKLTNTDITGNTNWDIGLASGRVLEFTTGTTDYKPITIISADDPQIGNHILLTNGFEGDETYFTSYIDQFDVAINADGEAELIVKHVHDFTYAAEDNKITAKCSVGECKLEDSKKEFTIEADDKDYDGTAADVTLEGIDDFNEATGLDLSLDDVVFSKKKGNDWEETAGVPVNAGKYKASITVDGATATTEFEINKIDLTITANNVDLIYGNEPADDGVTCDGFVGEENIDSLNGTLQFETDYVQYGDVGEYDITPKGLTSDNYDITFVKGTVKVAPLALRFKWSDESEFVYDGKEKKVSATADNALNGDKLTAVITNNKKINAGDYEAKVTAVTGDKATNYIIDPDEESVTKVWTIKKADTNNITVSIKGWTYGDEPSEPACTADFGADNAEYKYSDAVDGVYTDEVPVDAGIYYVKAFIPGTDNYAESESAPCKFNIKKALLTAKADSVEAVYGDETDISNITFEGFKNDEDESVLTGDVTVKAIDKDGNEAVFPFDAGEYTLVASGYSSDNYTVKYIKGVLKVNPRPLTFTWEGDSFTYDGTAKYVYAYAEGIVDGDVVVLTVPGTVEKNAGEYTAEVTGIMGDKAYNYMIDENEPTATHEWTIRKASLKISPKDKTIKYGEAPENIEMIYEGFAEGESQKNLFGKLSLEFIDEEGNPYSAFCAAGQYRIVPSGFTSDNYDITYEEAVLTVERLEGGLQFEIRLGDGVKGIVIDNDDDKIINAVITDEDRKVYQDGGEVLVYFTIEQVVPSAEDMRLLSEAKGEDMSDAVFYDIKLFKEVSGREVEQIHGTLEPISFTFFIPDRMQDSDAEGRVYQVFRLHDGNAEELPSTFKEVGMAISAGSDKFSLFAVTYTDKDDTEDNTEENTEDKDNTEDNTDDKDNTGDKDSTEKTEQGDSSDEGGNKADVKPGDDAAKTGDETPIMLIFIIMMVAAVDIALTGNIIRIRKKSEK
ncbi:hypothetical protein SAMN04487934_101309 [Eubacterium ruminantium]|nr:hypothetical protein SAMN04487934_101309 [Eubacterium ruminantium]